jgi:hypothetical protein
MQDDALNQHNNISILRSKLNHLFFSRNYSAILKDAEELIQIATRSKNHHFLHEVNDVIIRCYVNTANYQLALPLLLELVWLLVFACYVFAFCV